MALLHWKPEYEVGIEPVDYEHRQLIELINRLHAEFNGADAARTTPAFFGDLLKAISAHFALEEKLMRDLGYHGYPPHKADHERLLDELCDIMDACEQQGDVNSSELTARLDSWFMVHFKLHDAHLPRGAQTSHR